MTEKPKLLTREEVQCGLAERYTTSTQSLRALATIEALAARLRLHVIDTHINGCACGSCRLLREGGWLEDR